MAEHDDSAFLELVYCTGCAKRLPDVLLHIGLECVLTGPPMAKLDHIDVFCSKACIDKWLAEMAKYAEGKEERKRVETWIEWPWRR